MLTQIILWLSRLFRWDNRPIESHSLDDFLDLPQPILQDPRPTTVRPPVPVPAPPSPKPMPDTPKPVGSLLWATPKQAWHSTRVLCDRSGLDWDEKNTLCATVFGESEFVLHATNDNGKSKDHSLGQYNDGPPGVPPSKKWYIGPGKLFSSVEDVYANPERQMQYMIDYLKQHGHLNPWYAYAKRNQFILKSSRMWALAKT